MAIVNDGAATDGGYFRNALSILNAIIATSAKPANGGATIRQETITTKTNAIIINREILIQSSDLDMIEAIPIIAGAKSKTTTIKPINIATNSA